MNKPENCVIIGGGQSIQEGVSLGLKDFLKDKFVLACNYAFLHFPHTALVFTDRDFYAPHPELVSAGWNPDISPQLRLEPLILCGWKNDGLTPQNVFPNTKLLKRSDRFWGSEGHIKGFYKGTDNGLVGFIALSIACDLLKEDGNIFLLGFDWTISNKTTHYYKDVRHHGVGVTKYYQNNSPERLFKPFEASKCKIYNVNMTSNIPNFEKITYQQFFTQHPFASSHQESCRRYISENL